MPFKHFLFTKNCLHWNRKYAKIFVSCKIFNLSIFSSFVYLPTWWTIWFSTYMKHAQNLHVYFINTSEVDTEQKIKMISNSGNWGRTRRHSESSHKINVIFFELNKYWDHLMSSYLASWHPLLAAFQNERSKWEKKRLSLFIFLHHCLFYPLSHICRCVHVVSDLIFSWISYCEKIVRVQQTFLCIMRWRKQIFRSNITNV